MDTSSPKANKSPKNPKKSISLYPTIPHQPTTAMPSLCTPYPPPPQKHPPTPSPSSAHSSAPPPHPPASGPSSASPQHQARSSAHRTQTPGTRGTFRGNCPRSRGAARASAGPRRRPRAAGSWCPCARCGCRRSARR